MIQCEGMALSEEKLKVPLAACESLRVAVKN